nr:MAG TPA: hypothetical protein [Caudoviricetes sp.]
MALFLTESSLYPHSIIKLNFTFTFMFILLN